VTAITTITSWISFWRTYLMPSPLPPRFLRDTPDCVSRSCDYAFGSIQTERMLKVPPVPGLC
jgi:hypothetical protein